MTVSRCRWMCGSPLSRMPQQSKLTGKPCLAAAAKARFKPGWSASIGRPSVKRLLTVGSASGADDVGAELTCELRDHRPDGAGGAVHEDALPRPKAAVLEQSLPRRQARHRHARAHREVDVARQRREVACLDGDILRQGAAAIRVREAEHPLSHRQPGRAVAESGNHSGQLLPGNNRRPVTAEAIGPGRGPRQLIPGESRRMNLNDDVVDRCLRLGPLHQLHPGRSRSLICHHNRFHRPAPCVVWTLLFFPCSLFEFICIRSSNLAVKYWVALYAKPVVGFRWDVAAEAVILVISRDLGEFLVAI